MLKEERLAILRSLEDPQLKKTAYCVDVKGCVIKSSILSKSEICKGKELMEKRTHTMMMHEEIWRNFSRAIALAPIASEELAQAYSERAFLLLHLAKYSECIVDIDRALSATKCKELEVKLLCYKAICQGQNDLVNAQAHLTDVKSRLDKSNYDEQSLSKLIDEMNDIRLSLNSATKTGPKEPTLRQVNDFSSVTSKFNAKYGRHLIATHDIQPGEVIFVERPYVSALNIDRNHAYCGHCFKACWTLIPCDSCSWCMFCSEKCKEDALEQYHDIECSVFSYGNTINFNRFSKKIQICLRLLIVEWRRAGSNITNLRAIVESTNRNTDDSLCDFLSLCHSVNKPESLRVSTFIALYVTALLARFSTFFGKQYGAEQFQDLITTEDALFVCSLLSKFSQMYDSFSTPITNKFIFDHPYGDEAGRTYLYRGECIATVSALLNHSCAPNSSRCFTEDNRLIVFAIQPIKKGEQIFVLYLETCYFITEKETRQSALRGIYNFTCDCPACFENWPQVALYVAKIFMDDEENTYPPLSSFENLFLQSFERKLYKKHEDEIVSLMRKNRNFKFTEEMIRELSTSITKAIKRLGQNACLTSNLIRTLEIAFARFHGAHIEIPHKCNW